MRSVPTDNTSSSVPASVSSHDAPSSFTTPFGTRSLNDAGASPRCRNVPLTPAVKRTRSPASVHSKRTRAGCPSGTSSPFSSPSDSVRCPRSSNTEASSRRLPQRTRTSQAVSGAADVSTSGRL